MGAEDTKAFHASMYETDIEKDADAEKKARDLKLLYLGLGPSKLNAVRGPSGS